MSPKKPSSTEGSEKEQGPGLSIATRTGWASGTDNHFRGYAIGADLLGKESFWSMMSLAVGGPRLDDNAAGMLSDLAISAAAADPRIWPLKLVRLVAAYGRPVPALASFFLTMDGSMLGWTAAKKASLLLLDLAEVVGDADNIEEVIWQRLQQRRDSRTLYGFGVPLRPADERLVALTGRVEERGFAARPYWRLSLSAAAVILRETGIKANIALGGAAVYLDQGFGPEQMDVLGAAALSLGPWANALEGAQQAPECLRRLPDSMIDYRGPEARPSPRATKDRNA